MNRTITQVICSLVLMLGLTGCGLIPKKVELFQDKVKPFPTQSTSEREAQRQAAQRAKETAQKTVAAAIEEQSSPAVLVPAKETEKLTGAVAESLGPPVHPASVGTTSDQVAEKLLTAVAKLNRRIDDFKNDNNENAGKKIEGTGLVSVPYFLWVAIIGAVLFVIWHVLKTLGNVAAAGSPPVAVGMKIASVGGKLLSRGFSQLIEGGEQFKDAIEKEIKDADLKNKVLSLFKTSHQVNQDTDVQNAIKDLTK